MPSLRTRYHTYSIGQNFRVWTCRKISADREKKNAAPKGGVYYPRFKDQAASRRSSPAKILLRTLGLMPALKRRRVGWARPCILICSAGGDGKMRDSGVRGVLVNCQNYQMPHVELGILLDQKFELFVGKEE